MPFISPSIAHPFLITFLLLSSRLLLETNAKTFKKTLDTVLSTRSCAFRLGGYSYDLCPLAGEAIPAPNVNTADNQRVPQSSSNRYLLVDPFNIKELGSDHGEQNRNEDAHCGYESWICFMDIPSDSTSAVKLTPLAWRDKESTEGSEIIVLLDVDEGTEGHVYPSLRLFTNNIRENDVLSPVDIILSCSKTSQTKYFSQELGVSLRLDTPHACPKDVTLSVKQMEDGGQEEKEGNDDLMPKQGMSTLRKLMIVALFVFVIPLVCGAILLTSARARKFTINKVNGVASTVLPMISIAAVKLRPIRNKINTFNSKLKSPFRPGSNKLVLWAQEDMSLADSEDMMVNGSGALDEDGWHAEGLEEYIPLSANPRHGRYKQVKSYGSTPVVETFEERREGWLGRYRRYFRI